MRLGDHLNCHCHCLTAPNTQGRDTALAATAMQPVNERGENASASRSDRVAKCASTAIYVDAPMVDIYVPHRDHGDRSECLIDLVQIRVMRAPPELRRRPEARTTSDGP